MSNLLVVDDDSLVRKNLGRILTGQGYYCSFASNSSEARKHLETQPADLAFCDVELPGESGIHLARYIKHHHKDTAIIMLTSRDDATTVDGAIDAAADGYMLKPFNTNEMIISTRNALQKRKLEILNRKYRQHLEEMLVERTTKLKNAVNNIFLVLSRMVEAKDPYTAGHQLRVSELAAAIFKEYGATKDHVEGIRLAGMIHDLGKISVPADILSKPSRLTKLEYDLVRTHSRSGSEILKGFQFPWPIADMILQHHERLDGTGYPQGLTDGDILPEAKVLGVADVLEAMASYRPYRPALGLDKALSEIESHRGKYYDPDVVDALLRVDRQEVAAILQ
ncbi:MAG: response regulator [Candidatus Aminicenantes bacterium]|nr:response regulator [Candidatus Aminicenantes bacterium]